MEEDEITGLRRQLRQTNMMLTALVRRDGRIRIARSEIESMGDKDWTLKAREDQSGAIVLEVGSDSRVVRGVQKPGAKLRT